ncbi:potassium/proton antiporter [Thiohalorhabdus sp.]|uniref:potassium/proton antiporter n=1 Tax=Thiohalorhabdus sp. TaxID=3094134 RepID=UPI002FC35F21
MAEINSFLLVGGLLILVSVLVSTLSGRLGFPLLLVFLGVGMLAGEDGPGGIQFDDFRTAFLVGNLALAVILLDGGLRTSLSTFRVALWPAAVLATWGVVCTAALVGGLAAWLLDTSWLYGALIGSMVASTDAAAVFSLLRSGGIQLNSRVRSVLEIESGINDPMAVFLVIGLVEQILAPGAGSVADMLWLLGRQFALGIGAGLLGGWLLAWLVERIQLAEGLFALLVGSGGLVIFAGVNYVGGSGFLAIYLTGLVVGNRRSAVIESILKPMDGLAWLAQAGMFLILGLLVTPSALVDHAPAALALALFLMVVARPLAVVTSLAPFRFAWREMGFVGWTGLRGAVPIVLAVFPVMAGASGAQLLFDSVFAVVVASLLIQGTSLPLAARWFRVMVPHQVAPTVRREVWHSGTRAMELVAFSVEPGAPIVGQSVGQRLTAQDGLSLRPVLVVRDQHPLLPERADAIQERDLIWVLCDTTWVERLARLFAAEEAEAELTPIRFFGEFAIRADATGADLRQAYALPLAEGEDGLPLARIIEQRLGRPPVVGDRVDIGRSQLVVRDMEGERVAQVGLKLSGTGGGP